MSKSPAVYAKPKRVTPSVDALTREYREWNARQLSHCLSALAVRCRWTRRNRSRCTPPVRMLWHDPTVSDDSRNNRSVGP